MDLLADRLMVFDGEPAEHGHAGQPQEMRSGMNDFLSNLDITFRRDERVGRPRINKPDSQLDRQQKKDGEYYYSVWNGPSQLVFVFATLSGAARPLAVTVRDGIQSAVTGTVDRVLRSAPRDAGVSTSVTDAEAEDGAVGRRGLTAGRRKNRYDSRGYGRLPVG